MKRIIKSNFFIVFFCSITCLLYADTLPDSVLIRIAIDEANKNCQIPDHKFIFRKTSLANHKLLVRFDAAYKGIKITTIPYLHETS